MCYMSRRKLETALFCEFSIFISIFSDFSIDSLVGKRFWSILGVSNKGKVIETVWASLSHWKI